MAVRDDAGNPLTAESTPVASLHLCVGPALVEENQPLNGDIRERFCVPAFPFLPNIRPIPFLGDGGFFFV